jgi:heat shock protein HslJ
MNVFTLAFAVRSMRAAGLVACMVLAGCGDMPARPVAAADSPPAAHRLLAGTTWRLVEIKSMGDATGTARPDDRAKYTMQLRDDGTVAMQLNCNRASGAWTAAPAADAISGRFTFGPLAGTRALCPPPSLDERVIGQAPQVRGYLLKDGRLNLSLMADTGILVWEPADIEAPFVTIADAALEAALLAAHPGYTRKLVAAAGASGPARYVHGRADLNGDGRAEVVVFVMGPDFCGNTGCTLMLFTEAAGRYTLLKEFAGSRPPLITSPMRTRGWNDLLRIESSDGRAVYVRHAFDGKTYVEAARMPVGETSPEGRRLLVGELGDKVGAPLIPRE